MRNRETIEREMFRAREDLESSIAELKHVVQEKVDVKARAQVAIEKGKILANDAFERGKQTAVDLAHIGKAGAAQLAERGIDGAKELARRGEDQAYVAYRKARERPVLTASIVGGVVAVGVLVYVGRRNDWW